jgi:hypothetical protein
LVINWGSVFFFQKKSFATNIEFLSVHRHKSSIRDLILYHMVDTFIAPVVFRK